MATSKMATSKDLMTRFDLTHYKLREIREKLNLKHSFDNRVYNYPPESIDRLEKWLAFEQEGGKYQEFLETETIGNNLGNILNTTSYPDILEDRLPTSEIVKHQIESPKPEEFTTNFHSLSQQSLNLINSLKLVPIDTPLPTNIPREIQKEIDEHYQLDQNAYVPYLLERWSRTDYSHEAQEIGKMIEETLQGEIYFWDCFVFLKRFKHQQDPLLDKWIVRKVKSDF